MAELSALLAEPAELPPPPQDHSTELDEDDNTWTEKSFEKSTLEKMETIVVSGAVGPFADLINGVYEPEKGMPRYKKTGETYKGQEKYDPSFFSKQVFYLEFVYSDNKKNWGFKREDQLDPTLDQSVAFVYSNIGTLPQDPSLKSKWQEQYPKDDMLVEESWSVCHTLNVQTVKQAEYVDKYCWVKSIFHKSNQHRNAYFGGVLGDSADKVPVPVWGPGKITDAFNDGTFRVEKLPLRRTDKVVMQARTSSNNKLVVSSQMSSNSLRVRELPGENFTEDLVKVETAERPVIYADRAIRWKEENLVFYGIIIEISASATSHEENTYSVLFERGETRENVRSDSLTMAVFTPNESDIVFSEEDTVLVNYRGRGRAKLRAKILYSHNTLEGNTVYDVIYLNGQGIEHDVPPERIELIEGVSDENDDNDKPIKYITQDHFDLLRSKTLYTSIPGSVYGCVVAAAVTGDGDTGGNCLFVPIMSLTWLVQGTLLYCIWKELPNVDDSALCHTSTELSLAVLAVFLGAVLPPLSDMLKEISIAATSTRSYREKMVLGQKFYVLDKLSDKNTRSVLSRLNLLLAVGCELVIWISVVVVGCAYILSQEGAGDIVQGAVAINFLNDIDNMVFDLVISGDLRDMIMATSFEVPILPPKKEDRTSIKDPDEFDSEECASVCSVCCAVPCLVFIVVGIVIGLQHSHCHNITHY